MIWQKIAEKCDKIGYPLGQFWKKLSSRFSYIDERGLKILINKRFPANTTLTQDTFLNDKKVDAELYAFLISLSYPDETKRTITRKIDLPT